MKITLCSNCGKDKKDHPVELWIEKTDGILECEKFIGDDGVYCVLGDIALSLLMFELNPVPNKHYQEMAEQLYARMMGWE